MVCASAAEAYRMSHKFRQNNVYVKLCVQQLFLEWNDLLNGECVCVENAFAVCVVHDCWHLKEYKCSGKKGASNVVQTRIAHPHDVFFSLAMGVLDVEGGISSIFALFFFIALVRQVCVMSFMPAHR